MRSSLKLINISLVSLYLSACGGGGGDGTSTGGSGNNGPTPSQIIANAAKYSKTELQTAAKKIADAGYTGLKTNADIDVALTQRAFVTLFGDSSVEIPELVGTNFENYVDGSGSIDKTVNCDISGTVKYTGTVTENVSSTLTLSLNACQQYENDYSVTGKAALVVSNTSDTSGSVSVYFDNVKWTDNGQAMSLSGYSNIQFSYTGSPYHYSFNTAQYVMFSVDNQKILVNSELDLDDSNAGLKVNLDGDLYFGDRGKIAVSFDDLPDYPPYFFSGSIEFIANKKAALEFGSPYIRYVEDSDNDGSYDRGTYFYQMSELLNIGNAAEKTLVALADLSLPPRVGSPYFYDDGDVYTSDVITVEQGSIYDPDTSEDQLTISYRWYVNDVEVAGQTSATLPAFIAVFGDTVKVTMVVADGANVIESTPRQIEIQDSPLEFQTANVPGAVRAGDLVQFNAVLYDPDRISQNTSASHLIGAPEGATMDENGLITWQVPSDMLFSVQTYQFTFGIPDTNGQTDEAVTVSIEVSSDKPFPIVRSGMTVPRSSNSMWVGDFNGDGQNEVLSTDSFRSVFLVEHQQDSGYQQTWVYPFNMPTQGRIQQVLPANMDDDAALEILVVTEHGVSVINGLNTLATVLFETDDYISNAAIAGGANYLAYLSSSSQYSSSGSQLKVLALDQPDTLLFNTNVAEAKQLIFANVDQDSALELITNNGLVYDTAEWSNQWFSGNGFGDSLVTAGDYNNDGIDEIAGANSWGSLSVYSAVSKSQLATLVNFNTCTLHSANLDSDAADELVVGDCQWGNISTYKLTDGALSLVMQIDSQDHGSSSLTTGDSDNDGKLELHWGSGISHSGEDIFVSAEIDGNTLTLEDNSGNVQLDSFSSAGWSQVSDGQERAVFFIPSTRSGYGSSRIGLLDESGQLSLSDDLSSNWDRSSLAVTSDYNNDGFGDIFVPATDLYNGSFAAIQLYDFSIQWQTSGNYDSDIGLIRASDVNGDGFEDAVYLDGQILKAIDVNNQQVITNYTFNGYVNDFVTFTDSGVAQFIVARGSRLTYLSLNGASLSEQTFIEQSCHQLELINIDADPQLELMCLDSNASSYSNQKLIIFELGDNRFTEKASYLLNDQVTNIVADPSTTDHQNFFFTVTVGDVDSYWNNDSRYQIKKMSTDAQTIWTSPSLIGQPSARGLKVRLSDTGLQMMLSTSSMMYWIK